MNIDERDDAVIIEPRQAATAAVVWLHGLGADGHDFVPIVAELGLARAAPLRFVFPHAPVRPVTINAGMPMRAWYDILSLGDMRRQDEAGIRDSERIVRRYLQQQVEAGIAHERLVLAGFSQGGAIALHTGLRLEQRLGGILALSTYLPLLPQFEREAHAANRATPIFMAHGSADPMLPQPLGEHSATELRRLGHAVEWHSYPMQHEVCLQEIADIGRWLRGVLGVDAGA